MDEIRQRTRMSPRLYAWPSIIWLTPTLRCARAPPCRPHRGALAAATERVPRRERDAAGVPPCSRFPPPKECPDRQLRARPALAQVLRFNHGENVWAMASYGLIRRGRPGARVSCK